MSCYFQLAVEATGSFEMPGEGHKLRQNRVSLKDLVRPQKNLQELEERTCRERHVTEGRSYWRGDCEIQSTER